MNKRLLNVLFVAGVNLVIWIGLLYFSFVLEQSVSAVPNDEHTVCPAGPPSCDFATIQAAVDSAIAGDNIVVAAGHYVENVVISKTLTVQGAGIAITIVDGNALARVFVIEEGSTVTITDLTITNGYSDFYAGGIFNDSGILILDTVAVEGNSALRGSGITNFGTLTMTGGMVTNNIAIGDNVKQGAGIYNNGALSLIHTIIFNNRVEVGGAYGGGLYIGNGNAVLSNTTIISNSAQIGGGVYNSNGGSRTTITDSRIQLNTVIFDGGGIYNNEGEVWINNTSVNSNSAQYGGGIWNGEILTVTNSTVSNNLATNIGGGVRNSSGSSATVINSTISGNTAIDRGGGILSGADGEVTLLNSTITNNEAELGGGIYNLCCKGIVMFANSIIAGNQAGNDCAGEDSFVSFGYNLDSDHSCHLTAIGDISGVDPGLGPLQDNGGDAYTHALLFFSPAIDTGNPATPGSDEYACQPLDQRGRLRPMDGDNNGSFICDMGAYELPTLEPWIYLPAIVKP
jgi:hypothetical protein